VDPIPDPLLFRKSGSAGNQTWTSEYLARNSDHGTTTAVPDTFIIPNMVSTIFPYHENKYTLISDKKNITNDCVLNGQRKLLQVSMMSDLELWQRHLVTADIRGRT
jgi:hypothetical protein